MFISNQHKIMMLFNPKTGSASLHRYLRMNVPDADFGPAGRNYPKGQAHWHTPMREIVRNLVDINDLPNWRIASFYRDPVDRFLSGFAWHKRKHPDLVPIDMTIRQYIEDNLCFSNQTPFLTDQIALHLPRDFSCHNLNWTWFNFHDYENEFIRFASWFGLTPSVDEIPHIHNSGNNRLYIDDLTAEELQMIKTRYEEDYQLFQSRSIKVPSA